MDTLILIITAIVLVETSVLLVQRRSGVKAVSTPFGIGNRSILVDTSVLIDGRILDIANAGFVPGRLVIPRSVLGELQLLADGSDHEKRARARNGLEVITHLQEIPAVTVEIYPDESEAREGVDNRLLALARQLTYELCTVDYNLQKVAQAEGITILSINELSQKLRALYLPGEKLELQLKQKGQEKGQAVGYASDGTMVVVDNADKLIDQTVPVEVIRSLQTSSGKMMFAKLVNPPANAGNNGRRQSDRGTNDRRNNDKNANNDATSAPASAKPQRERAPRQERTERQPRADRPERTDRVQKPLFGRNRRPAKQSPEDELLNLVNKQ